MSSAETSKKEGAEEKAPLPLKVTIEDPNTGDTVTIQPHFFVGLYTRRDENAPEGAVGVGQILKGAANVLEQIAIVKAMQEKAVPMILDQIGSDIYRGEKDSPDRSPEKLNALLTTLLLGVLSQEN